MNALWTAEMLGVMAEEGTDIGCFWALHNSFPPRGGDYGYLSSEGSNSPSFSYNVFPMFVEHFGNQIVQSKTIDRRISVYAARDGKALRLLIINKDSTAAKQLTIALTNFVPQKSAKVRVLDKQRRNESLADIQNVSRKCEFSVAPYSLTAIEFLASDSVLAPTNLATIAAPSASSYSTIGPNFKPDRAIDGKMYTRWNSAAWTKSNGQEVQSFQLQWNQPQQISEVRIFWGDTYGTVYTLEYSLDGKSWTIAREVSNGEGGVAALTFQPITARFVRINGKQGSKGISAYSIREIEVY
ncbi:MAG: discoidin domain-containing protein [Ignavibacteriae bacterium]|nr:discoidin domain-containing protein [Ignavibacteriota bacterium]